MFLVVELQRNDDTLGNVTFSYSGINEAKAKYHTILSVAAVSNVQRHGAVILDDTGMMLCHEWFDHEGDE